MLDILFVVSKMKSLCIGVRNVMSIGVGEEGEGRWMGAYGVVRWCGWWCGCGFVLQIDIHQCLIPFWLSSI